ncbi:MAG: hypothetical protein ACK5FW_07380 [Acidimicrobiaceae bacterium]
MRCPSFIGEAVNLLSTSLFRSNRLYSALSTAFFFALVAYVVDSTTETAFLAGVFGFLYGLIGKQFSAVFLGFALSLVACTVCALLAATFVPSYSLDGQIVLSVFLFIALVITVCTPSISNTEDERKFAVSFVGAIVLIGVLLRGVREWTSESAFGFLASSGEDNAAWLLALSKSVADGQTQLTAASSQSGGPGTGVLINIVRQLMTTLGEVAPVSNAENALVLARAYVIVGVITALSWFVVGVARTSSIDFVSRCAFGAVGGVLGYAFIMGVAAAGHFSAGVAVMFLSFGVVTYLLLPDVTRRDQVLKYAIVFLSLIAAGQSWFPLTGLAFVYIFGICVVLLVPFVKTKPTAKTIRWMTFSAVAVLVFAYVSYTRLFASFLQNALDLDYVIMNLTIAGGYSTVNAWIVALSFIAMVMWAFNSDELQKNRSHWVLPLVIVIPTVLLFTWSYFLAPYVPQYGAWKYLYISVAVTAPAAVVISHRFIPQHLSRSTVRLVPIVLVFISAMFSPPWNSIQWTVKLNQPSYTWASAVVQELRDRPTSPVGCVNTTKGDVGQNYIAYLCSRMAFGLGGFDEVEHRVWTAANICQISPEQARATFDDQFQKNFTAILFDGTRTSSFADCQAPITDRPEVSNGWLSSISWSKVRKLDVEGNVVKVKPTVPEKE